MLRALKLVHGGAFLGAVLCFVLSWDFNVFPLICVAWTLVLWGLKDRPNRTALGISYLLACVVYLILMRWMIPTSLLGWVFTCLYLSLYWPMFVYIYKRWGDDHPWAVAWSWVILEYVRETLLTGLPWLPLGSALSTSGILRQSASLWGVMGLSFVVMIFNVALSNYWQHKNVRSKRDLLLACLALLGCAAYGYVVLQKTVPASPKKAFQMGALRTDLSIAFKWDRKNLDQVVAHHEQLSRTYLDKYPEANLVVWPETAIPDYLRRRPLMFRRLAQIAHDYQTYVMVGAMDVTMKDGKGARYYNSAMLLSPHKTLVKVYNKIKVLPFGEYTPLKHWFPWMSFLVQNEADFSPGQHWVLFEVGSVRFANLICYEDSFSGFVRQFAQRGAEFFLVSTNDAWFGSAHARQRLKMIRMRAVEFARPIVRVANQGVTAWTDVHGEIVKQHDDLGVMDVTLLLPDQARRTVYSRWGYFMFWPLTVLCLWTLSRRKNSAKIG